uniref:Uncharacterized protein n=1 Tax=viral metagenome TaxID=1070528 RepID=A0A6C0LHR9_9ZZZZ
MEIKNIFKIYFVYVIYNQEVTETMFAIMLS